MLLATRGIRQVVYRLAGDAEAFCRWQETICAPVTHLPSRVEGVDRRRAGGVPGVSPSVSRRARRVHA